MKNNKNKGVGIAILILIITLICIAVIILTMKPGKKQDDKILPYTDLIKQI